MKTAEQWQNELAGETSERSIQRIQCDALTHVVTLLTLNAKEPHRAVGEICLLIARLTDLINRKTKHPNAP